LAVAGDGFAAAGFGAGIGGFGTGLAAAFTGAFAVTFTCGFTAALAGFTGCLVFVFAAVFDGITVLVRRLARAAHRQKRAARSAPPGTNQESAVSARLH
jgi:hypothetical protein